tara:strand:+ start:3523 stop:3705 length:183 start_codon:yes stop_codon:yes gene_type:complete
LNLELKKRVVLQAASLDYLQRANFFLGRFKFWLSKQNYLLVISKNDEKEISMLLPFLQMS